MTTNHKSFRQSMHMAGFKDKLFWLSEDALLGFESVRKHLAAMPSNHGKEIPLSQAVNYVGRNLYLQEERKKKSKCPKK